MADHPPLITIVGPTGVGKTALAIAVARAFSGRIISADSRQIYRLMDIGTAKPTPQELAAAPHHLVDIVPPDYVLTLAEFQERAYAAINLAHAEGALPLLVGGTGQWVWAVVEGWGVPRVPPDPAQCAELAADGPAALHARLAAVDPAAAANIDPRNVRRVIRALEVYHKTGQPISRLQRKSPPPYRILLTGLTMPREQLYRRIDARIDRMMEQGLLAEVQSLLAQGYSLRLPSMSGLGYRQLGQYLAGAVTLDEAVAQIKKETRRFIRQQYNWFRPADDRIRWVDVSPGFEAGVLEMVGRFLRAEAE
ncbi:MAG: tRNA (adenosine(37)-N6)-dimethylallyltransferase MiaA [Anaerolineae bacterium]